MQDKQPPNLLRFWEELKRRRVIRAAFIYIAVAWAILEASDTIFPLLGLPDWTLRFVLILLIIVFILVIVLTWIYDITPEGIKVTERLDKGKIKGSAARPGTLKTIPVKRISAFGARYSRLKKFILPLTVIVAVALFMIFKTKLATMAGIESPARQAAKAHVSNAVAMSERGDYTGAAAELELALESDSGYSYVWSSMAALSVKQGDLSRAVLQTIEAVRLDPENVEAAYNMAFALDDRNDNVQAIRWYSEAIRMDSSFVPAYSALGRLYNQVSQPVDAILLLGKAAGRFQDSEYSYLIYKNLGNAHLLMDQYDEAIKYLELSYGIKPDEPETCLFLARTYEATGKITRSIDLWQKYIELETDTAKSGPASRHMKEIAIRYLQGIGK